MTHKALISPNEPIYNYASPPVEIGVRIAQVVVAGDEFDVAEPLYWVPCADDVDASTYYWDGLTAVVKPIPPPSNDQAIADLKQKLAETDYVGLTDYDKQKPELLAQRQEWRDEIRRLEAE